MGNQFAGYVSEQGKNNLVRYKYVGQDNSFISPYLQPWWNFSVQLLPLWMAPNLVTFIGFIGIILGYLITAFYLSADMGGTSLPWWMYILNIFFLLAYQTLDAIDGKQARRTNSSSPLGELFDHGCDALGGMLQTMNILMIAQVGHSWWAFFSMVSVNVMFYISIWEQYHTAVLYFHSLAGPTEALLMTAAAHGLTGIVGPHIWNYKLFGLLRIVDLMILFIVLSTVSAVVGAFQRISGKIAKGDISHETIKRKGHPYGKLSSFVFLILNFSLFFLLSKENILQTHTFLVCSLCGILGGYITTRIVLCRVCDMKVNYMYWILIPLPLLIVNARVLHWTSEVTSVWIYLVYTVIMYSHFVIVAINELTSHLGIYCFKLNPHQYEAALANQNRANH